jgi:hypothetical protein
MFYRNRMYSPGLGRFGRRDLVLGGDPQFNTYVFPWSAPVDTHDAYGLGGDDEKIAAINEKSHMTLYFGDISRNGKLKFGAWFPKDTCSMTAMINGVASATYKPLAEWGGPWGGLLVFNQPDFELDLSVLKNILPKGITNKPVLVNIPMAMVLHTPKGDRWEPYALKGQLVKFSEEQAQTKIIADIGMMQTMPRQPRQKAEDMLKQPRGLRVKGQVRRDHGKRIYNPENVGGPPNKVGEAGAKAAVLAAEVGTAVLASATLATFNAESSYYNLVPTRRDGALFGPTIILNAGASYGSWTQNLTLSLEWKFASGIFDPERPAPIIATTHLYDEFDGLTYDKPAPVRLHRIPERATPDSGYIADYEYMRSGVATTKWELDYEDKWFVTGRAAKLEMKTTFVGPGPAESAIHKSAEVLIRLPGK